MSPAAAGDPSRHEISFSIRPYQASLAAAVMLIAEAG
jgi:hypothetical protein